MTTSIYDQDHGQYRDAFRSFIAAEIAPRHAEWEQNGVVDRSVWETAGKQGHLCHSVPPEFGGSGVSDFRFSAVIAEELAYALAHGPFFSLHTDIVAPYIQQLGTTEQQARWLPGMVAGTSIGAIAMTEPGTGSDLAGIRTTAARQGGSYILNGAKTFISNGQLADLVIVVARTSEDPHRGLSLFVVERGAEGFTRGRNLSKVGMAAQDTSELFLDDVRVPEENLLGEEDQAFYHLVGNLPQERLLIAIQALGAIRRAYDLTLEYVTSRTAFGQPIGRFQNTRFRMAELATELEIATCFVEQCIVEHTRGDLTAERAAMAKWWTTDVQLRAIDAGLQLHGGYGYMKEYPIARMFVDSRAQTIYGGTNEVMKELIGRSIGL